MSILTNTPLRHVFPFVLAALVFPLMLSAAEKAEKVSPVKVTYSDPQKFTDVREDWGSESVANDRYREFVLDELNSYLQKTATPLLANGQTLEIKVTDIDLAGDFEPWRGFQFDSVRVVKDLYPPRMTLEFRLLDAAGNVVREGNRKLLDMSFLMSVAMPSHDSLRCEKEMLRNWLNQEFRKLNRAS